jgi:3-(methylthio)propanoyl-CoA dehydrogenase
MHYRAPLAEIRFVLDYVVGYAEIAANPRFAEADSDIVDAIIEGLGQFAENEFYPLSRVADAEPPRIVDGFVKMPPGFVAAYKAYVDNGWSSLSAPVDHGGQGLPLLLSTVAMEFMGSANMGFNLCPILTCGAIEALTHHGSPEQQAAYLPRLISGEWTGTMNLTEPQAGSDVGALRTMATPIGDGGYRIKGTKIFITFGDHDLTRNIVHLVLARTPGSPAGTKGISLFLVPKYRLDENGEPGVFNDVRAVKVEHKLGIHASPTCVMSFGDNDDCIGHLIGAENAGMRAMFTMMNNARLNVGVQGVQIAEAATQMALAYAHDRVQSPRASMGGQSVPIIAHPDVRRMLMRSKALTQGARALVYYAFAQLDRGAGGDENAAKRAELLTPLAKAYGTDIGCEVASLNIQVHGGMGYMEETGAAQMFRDARIAPIYEGTNGIQAADLVGRKLAMDGGAVMRSLIADIAADASDEPHLATLAEEVAGLVDYLEGADVDDRLAGSYAFLNMLSVVTAGWLMLRQYRAAGAQVADGVGDRQFLSAKQAVARYYLDCLVSEAIGLAASVRSGAGLLYALDDEAMLR